MDVKRKPIPKKGLQNQSSLVSQVFRSKYRKDPKSNWSCQMWYLMAAANRLAALNAAYPAWQHTSPIAWAWEHDEDLYGPLFGN